MSLEDKIINLAEYARSKLTPNEKEDAKSMFLITDTRTYLQPELIEPQADIRMYNNKRRQQKSARSPHG